MKVREILFEAPPEELPMDGIETKRSHRKALYTLKDMTPFEWDPKSTPTTKPKKGLEMKGTGVFSATFSKPAQPGTVRKVGEVLHDTPKDDPYLQYLNFVVKHQDNPYVPKIFDFKLFKHREETETEVGMVKYHYYVDMERLHPSKDINEQQALSMMERIVGPDKMTEPLKVRVHEDKAGVVWMALYEILDGSEASRNILSVADSQLRRVLTAIHNLEMKGHTLDLHQYNIMYRITKYGAYPVIIDPLS